MSSLLPIKKIYCDSKFRRFDSKSTSDFKIDLPQTIKLPDNCVCYIDDVSIPRTWYTVEENVNDKLYFRLTQSASIYYDHIITLDSKDYNGVQFASEVQNKITAATAGAVTLCSYDGQGTKKMSVSVNNQDIQFFADAELVKLNSLWVGVRTMLTI